MRPFPRLHSATISLLILVAHAVLVSCATRPLPVVEEIKIRDNARLLFQPVEGDRLILEAQLVEEVDGTLRLTVAKEKSVLQIVLQTGQVQAGGEWARRGWRGELAKVPQALRGWVAVLQAWELARQLPGQTIEVHRPDFRMQFQRSGHSPGPVRELVIWPAITSQNPAAAAKFVLKFQATH